MALLRDIRDDGLAGVPHNALTGKLEGQITPQVGPDASQNNVWATK